MKMSCMLVACFRNRKGKKYAETKDKKEAENVDKNIQEKAKLGRRGAICEQDSVDRDDLLAHLERYIRWQRLDEYGIIQGKELRNRYLLHSFTESLHRSTNNEEQGEKRASKEQILVKN